MHPPHFSILREVFSYIARFLPSKRYYLFLFIEHPLIFLSCFKSTGLWRFHFLPFIMLQASPWFPEGFIYFSFMAVSLKHSCIFPESIWLLKVFYFSFSFRMPCASIIYLLYKQELFMGFIFSLLLYTMPLACILLNNPACTGLLEGFLFLFLHHSNAV